MRCSDITIQIRHYCLTDTGHPVTGRADATNPMQYVPCKRGRLIVRRPRSLTADTGSGPGRSGRLIVLVQCWLDFSRGQELDLGMLRRHVAAEIPACSPSYVSDPSRSSKLGQVSQHLTA